MAKVLQDNDRRSHALFPQRHINVGHIHLDSIGLTQIFKVLVPESELLFTYQPLKPSDPMRDAPRRMQPDELASEDFNSRRDEIFEELLDMKAIEELRKDNSPDVVPDSQRFSFKVSIDTNGYDASTHFEKEIKYWKKGSTQWTRQRVDNGFWDEDDPNAPNHVSILNLKPGVIYSGKNKFLISDPQEEDSKLDYEAEVEAVCESGITIRPADFNVNRPVVTVDLYLSKHDKAKETSETAIIISGEQYLVDTKHRDRTQTALELADEALSTFHSALAKVPFRNSYDPKKYALYLTTTRRYWQAAWAFKAKKKLRALRFEGFTLRQSALSRIANRLAKPRPGDTRVMLGVGDAVLKPGGFGHVKGGRPFPHKALIKEVMKKPNVTVCKLSEFRSSKCGMDGKEVVHPLEKRRGLLKGSRAWNREKHRFEEKAAEQHKKPVPEQDARFFGRYNRLKRRGRRKGKRKWFFDSACFYDEEAIVEGEAQLEAWKETEEKKFYEDLEEEKERAQGAADAAAAKAVARGSAPLSHCHSKTHGSHVPTCRCQCSLDGCENRRHSKLWCSEHLFAQLDRLAVAPCTEHLEDEEHVHRPKLVGQRGCKHYCCITGCLNQRTVKYFCEHHRYKAKRYNVCHHATEEAPGGTKRHWNRDVLAAINIGARFSAQALGLELYQWAQTQQEFDTSRAKGWKEIFGDQLWRKIYRERPEQ